MKPVRMEHDRTKLPVWAQRELRRLEQDLASARARLAQGPENSRAFAEPYSASPRPLGPDPHIEFRFGESWHEKMTVSIERGGLRIIGGNGVAVFPESSNVVRVEVTS